MPHIRPRAFPPPGYAKSYLDTVDKTLTKTFAPSDQGKGTPAGTVVSDAIAKIVALIPAESIAAYQAIYNLTNNGKDPFFRAAVWIVLVGTPIWQLYATSVKKEPLAWDQAIISVPALLIWLVALQSPFLDLPKGWTPASSAMVLILGTFVLPILGWGLNLAIGAIIKPRT